MVFYISCKKSGNSSNGALTPDEFIGTWNGNISCNSGGYTHSMSISKDTVADQVILHNPGVVHRDLLGKIVSNTQIYMPAQEIDVDVWYQGTLTLKSSNSMTFDFTLGETGFPDSCHSSYTRQ
jgi:hypothetical protein